MIWLNSMFVTIDILKLRCTKNFQHTYTNNNNSNEKKTPLRWSLVTFWWFYLLIATRWCAVFWFVCCCLRTKLFWQIYSSCKMAMMCTNSQTNAVASNSCLLITLMCPRNFWCRCIERIVACLWLYLRFTMCRLYLFHSNGHAMQFNNGKISQTHLHTMRLEI